MIHRKPSRNGCRTGLKSITTPSPPQNPSNGYRRGKLESIGNGLTNQTPVPAKWPIDQKPTPDQILIRHRPPVAAVVTVVAVVAPRQIGVLRHDERTVWLRQIIAARSITAIRELRLHHAPESIAVSDFSIDIKKWRAKPHSVARAAGPGRV